MILPRFWPLAALGFLVLFTGCVQVTFPEPMPANRRELDAFPKAWRGTWTSHVNGVEYAGDDEIMVILEDRIKGDTKGEDLILGENCALKRMGRRLVLSMPQEEGGRHSVLVAQRHGTSLTIRSFDPKEDGAIDGWEAELGHDRVVKIHKKDDPTNKLKEVQLNPKNTCQFKKLVKQGTSELVTYTKVDEDILADRRR